MALTYGFYDSLNGDRKYTALQWSSIFDGVVNNGVFEGIFEKNVDGTMAYAPFACSATGNSLVLTVHKGRAWFDHTWIYSDGDVSNPITLSWAAGTDFAPDTVNPRIDAVVIQTDSTSTTRANSITRVKGTAASTPIKPTLTHTTYVNQYAIAYVTVPANATIFTQANVEYACGTTATPYVTGIIDKLDASAFTNQWHSEFDNWKTTEQADFLTWYNSLEFTVQEEEITRMATALENFKLVRTATFLASGWTETSSGSGIYTQTANCTGMTATANPIMVKNITTSMTAAERNTYNRIYGYISNGMGTTGAGTVTLQITTNPSLITSDITIGFKGL